MADGLRTGDENLAPEVAAGLRLAARWNRPDRPRTDLAPSPAFSFRAGPAR